MKNDWANSEAKKFIKKYKNLGFSKDIALRVYTSRLLGKNKKLVLHGGGNTSVKTRIKDIDGKKYEVLCVKGSGWDMADIEPEGLPAVKLEPLLAMKKKKYLSDEDMVSFQKRNLINIKSPNPSVETFLLAFLPFKYVDHTHSDAPEQQAARGLETVHLDVYVSQQCFTTEDEEEQYYCRECTRSKGDSAKRSCAALRAKGQEESDRCRRVDDYQQWDDCEYQRTKVHRMRAPCVPYLNRSD